MLKLLDISKFKGSIHTIYWPRKCDLSNCKKNTWKRLKKYWRVGIELSINDNTKSHKSNKYCGTYWINSYNLLTSKNSVKSRKQLKIILLFKSVLNTLQYLLYKYACVSWHFQNVMPNLQIRFAQFTDEKKFKIVEKYNSMLKYKLMLTFLDIFEICSMIQRLNSYNLLTNKKGLKKWLEQ